MLARGDTLAGYRIEGVVGHGGMGIVYRATQLSLDRVVALKVVAPHLGEDPLFRERFQREGRIQAGLDHPNIITIYEAGDSAQGLFIAMRLVHGHNLKELMIGGVLDPGRGLDILRQVADAIDAAHEAGLVHRDIKPQNILVGPRDHAYLADFGLTKPPGQRSLTQTGQLLGTLDYTSPEQIMGKPAVAQSDIYSFGAVLYECLTGVVPYPREAEGAVLYAHLTDPLPPPSSVNRSLPRALDEPVARALAKEARDRPGSAVELVDAVRQAAGRKLRPEPRRQVVIPPTPATATTIDALTPRVAGSGETPVDVPSVLTAARQRPARLRALSRRMLLTALAAVAILSAAGFALGSTVFSGSKGKTVRTQDLSVSLPPGWHQLAAPKAKYGMALSRSVQASGGGALLTIGWVTSANATLVPSQTAARSLGIDTTDPQTAGVGGGLAYAYTGHKRSLVAFFLATTRGDLTAVCEGPVIETCKSIAAGLRLLQATPLSPGPSPAYTKDVRSALQGAAAVRARERRLMAHSKAQSVQAAEARRVAASYASAAAGLTGAGGADPRLQAPTAAIVLALRSVSSSYGRLATAATRGNTSGYAAAATRVRLAEQTLTSKIAALRTLGYRLSPAPTKLRAVGPKAVSAGNLRAFAASVNRAVYWVGPRAGDTYELSATRDGLVTVRYLPAGVPVGTSKSYLKIRTIPLQDALAATRAQLKTAGTSSLAVGGGGVAVYSRASPTNIYVAYPGASLEIELSDPSAGDARRLVTSGALTPVG